MNENENTTGHMSNVGRQVSWFLGDPGWWWLHQLVTLPFQMLEFTAGEEKSWMAFSLLTAHWPEIILCPGHCKVAGKHWHHMDSLMNTGLSAITTRPLVTGTQTHRPALWSSNTPSVFLPLSLCSSCSLCIDVPVPELTWSIQMPPRTGLTRLPRAAT